MNTKAFDNGYVGIKLNSVSDIMKYNALNTNFSICNEYEDYFDEYVNEDDGTGNFTEREPTENEKLERILQAFKDGQTLYAVFCLDCGEVVPTAATTMQTNFYVGQEVFTMNHNSVIKARVQRLWLSRGGETYFKDSDYITSDIVREMRNCVTTLSANKSTLDYISSRINACKAMEDDFAYLVNKEKNFYKLVKLSEMFATKEDLVKHLMEE